MPFGFQGQAVRGLKLPVGVLRYVRLPSSYHAGRKTRLALVLCTMAPKPWPLCHRLCALEFQTSRGPFRWLDVCCSWPLLPHHPWDLHCPSPPLTVSRSARLQLWNPGPVSIPSKHSKCSSHLPAPAMLCSNPRFHVTSPHTLKLPEGSTIVFYSLYPRGSRTG